MSETNLSAYDKAVMESAKHNHIWLNAFNCIRPTVEFKLRLADQIMQMLDCKENLIHNHQDSDNEALKRLGQLTPELVLRINKS